MKAAGSGGASPGGGERRSINPELWYACAGPLVNLPAVGSLVVYFPQGHSEQVAATMHKDAEAQIPNYPNLPWKIICVLHGVTLHADPETDEVYAQLTLQPANTNDKEAFLASDPSLKLNRPQTEFFCKTLTASDTSTHGGFSVPRRAAEKIFPPLDFSMQPPAQELQVKDLHDSVWTFRHIYRGQPKRHLLTTGWSLFVSGKRLVAGDSVLFIRDEKQQLLLGIRRASRQPTNISSSVLSSDSMQIGILAAAAHAYANQSPFTVFYNPRASPSEFVIPLAKYNKTIYSNQLSLGMRFRMMFETEESGTRRYMGTITGISDLDPVRWKNSKWRNLQVGWDESAAGERRNRVSMWEIEPVQAPFFICPPPFFRTKRPRQPGMPDDDSSDMESLFKRVMPWLGEENGFSLKDSQGQNGGIPGLSLVQWMNMQNSSLAGSGVQPVVQNYSAPDVSKQLNLQSQINHSNAISIAHPQINQQNQNQNQNQNLNQNQIMIQSPQFQQQQALQQQQLRMLQQSPQQQQQQQQHLLLLQHQQQQQQGRIPTQLTEQQIHLQLLHKLQQQHLLGQLPFHTQEQQKATPPPLDQALLPLPVSLNQAARNPQLAAPPNKFQQSPVPPPAELAALAAIPPPSGFLTSRGTQSVLTEDVPSCSTSPSTNNCPALPPAAISGKMQQQPHGVAAMEAASQPASFADVKSLISAAPKLSQHVSMPGSGRLQNQAAFAPHPQQGLYVNQATPPHMDYLDTHIQTETQLQPNFPLASSSFSQQLQQQQPMFFRDGEVQASASDLRNNVLFGVNIESPLGIPIPGDQLLGKSLDSGRDFQTHLPSNAMDASFGGSKDTQAELSSSMVSQSFGVPDVGLNSIESAVNDGSSLLNKCSWPAQPQLQRMRTYTKVYKRGAVGRSIDIARYSGYDDLKQDLARMFSIEGQLEDRQRIGWKLVYVDHENDVLLVGDDPWEEFVNCVRCIRILSPQEVQQMSLDGEIAAGNGAVPNQACSSSDGGNAWRGNHCDQNSDPSPGSYGHID